MKKKITITIDEELLEKITEYATSENRTLSGQISKILKDYLASQGKA